MIAVCKHCDNEFYVPVELGGKTVKCSKCKKSVQAPEAPSISEITFEPEDSPAAEQAEHPSETNPQAEDEDYSIQHTDEPPSEVTRPTGSPTGPAERVQFSATALKPHSPPRRITKPAINPPSQSPFISPAGSVNLQLGSSRNLNFRKGFNRLTIVVSVLSAVTVGTIRYFYFRDPTVISAQTPLQMVLPWALGTFAAVWVVYLIGLFIARGFTRSSRILTGGWIRLTVLVSIMPLVPGIIKCSRYLMREPSWQFEQVYEFFMWWPIYTFTGIWAAFWLGMFVASGFKQTDNSQKIVRPKEKKIKKTKQAKVTVPPQTQTIKKHSWRTS